MKWTNFLFFLLISKILSSQFDNLGTIDEKFLSTMMAETKLIEEDDESNDFKFSFDEIVTRKG